MRIVTIDDFCDIYFKMKQKGFYFIFSKLNFIGKLRTKKAFNQNNFSASEWYIIPKIRERWNKLITGNENIFYEDFLMQEIFAEKYNLRLLSLGSGVCSHELRFASYPNFSEVICVDIAQNRLNEAKEKAKEKQLNNIHFVCTDAYTYLREQTDSFDVVLFHSSLHHFKNVNFLIQNQIFSILKNGGNLIINEYVGNNRLQFSSKQLKAVNQALKLIPDKYKKVYGTNISKKKFHGLGLLRMIIADPSECVESENILPAIYNNFKTIIEKPFGGNILMGVLKNISHNFITLDAEKEQVLNTLFAFEDDYLKENSSNFIFGVYEKNVIILRDYSEVNKSASNLSK